MKQLLKRLTQASLLTATIIFPTVIQAQPITNSTNPPDELKLTTSSIPITLESKPGKTISTNLRIQNSSTRDEALKVGLLKFSADSKSGQPKLSERQPGDSYFDWVSFSETSFTLAPREWKTIQMTIDIPEDAAFGYYYAVTFTRQTSVQPQSQTTAIIGSTASLVLLAIDSPQAKRQLKITDFSADRPWHEFLPVTFNATIDNTGNVHAIASGNIFIYQGDTLIDTLEVNSSRGNILPNSLRQFTSTWSDGFPSYQNKLDKDGNAIYADNQPIQQLNWDLSKANKLRFGKYRARLVMAYDDGHKDIPLQATVDFWVIPWRLILLSLLIPAVPAALVYVIMKRKGKSDQQI